MASVFPGAADIVEGTVENGVWLLVGPTGVGKSNFAKQFIWEGLKDGIPAVYVVADESPDFAVRSMEKFGFDVKPYIDRGEVAVVDCYSPRIGLQPSSEFSANPEDLNEVGAVIEQARKRFERLRFVIDSATSLVMNSPPLQGQKIMQIVAARIRQSGSGILVMEEGIPDPNFLNFFRYIFDGVFEMKLVESGQSLQRYFRVFSLKGAKHSTAWIPYVLTEKGIEFRKEQGPAERERIEGRKLSAIMFTDIAGYTQMTEENETLAMQLLEEHREIIRSILPSHGGREVKTIGDAFLVEFDSALAAVRCSVDIQKALFARNKSVSEERRIHVRIGVHVGDVEHRQGDIYGDAVNVASRIQSLAVPGGVTLSQQVHDLVRNKVGHPLVKLKRRELKNLATPIDLYSLSLKPEPG